MVWGMVSPRGLGDYFPDGNYVGWDDELTDYFINEMPAEQKAHFSGPLSGPHLPSYQYYVAEKLISEPKLQRTRDWLPFGPILPHEASKRYETEKPYASLASLVQLTGRILAVDGHLKHIIERFEPGVHHFFPLEVVMPGKRIYPEQYFIMAIGQYLDSISPEQSDPNSLSNESEWKGRKYYFLSERKKPMSGLALSQRVFGGAHLWCERSISNRLICASDQLMSEIALSGLKMPKHYKLREV